MISRERWKWRRRHYECDVVFPNCAVQDSNHNGTSEAVSCIIVAIRHRRLRPYIQKSKRVDENGNEFRYRAKVKDVRGAQVGRGLGMSLADSPISLR